MLENLASFHIGIILIPIKKPLFLAAFVFQITVLNFGANIYLSTIILHLDSSRCKLPSPKKSNENHYFQLTEKGGGGRIWKYESGKKGKGREGREGTERLNCTGEYDADFKNPNYCWRNSFHFK
jgi:hypothetical protein